MGTAPPTPNKHFCSLSQNNQNFLEELGPLYQSINQTLFPYYIQNTRIIKYIQKNIYYKNDI